MNVLRFLAHIWVIATAVIGSLLVVGFVALFFALQSSPEKLSPEHVGQKMLQEGDKQKIAVVNLFGEIMESENGGGFSNPTNLISARKVNAILDEVEKDDDVKAVILRTDTPGGAVVASDEIYQRVKKLAAKKPVVVSMGDVTASGGYYISAGATKIVANPATITGSIGVIAEFPEYSGLYDKIGVQMRVIKSGKFKDIGSPNRDMTPEETAIFNSLITDSYNQFVSAVATGRHLDEAKVRDLADGRIYSGVQAKNNGLVDELGNFDTAIDQAKKLSNTSNPSVVEYSNESFFESLFSAKFGGSGLNALTGVNLGAILPQDKFGMFYLMQ